MSIFNGFLETSKLPVSYTKGTQKTIDGHFESLKCDEQKKKTEEKRQVYIEKIKKRINRATDFKEKYLLSVHLIAKLSDDQRFYDENKAILEVLYGR